MLKPLQNTAPVTQQAHNNIAPPMESATGSVSALMDSSLPPMASGADGYVRQFYRTGQGLPQRRFFPVTLR